MDKLNPENKTRKILFYDDAGDFGGHEVMAASYLRELSHAENIELFFIYYEGNKRLELEFKQILAEGGRLQLIKIPYRHKPLHGLLPFLSLLQIFIIAKIIHTCDPDIVVVVQGSIDISFAGLIASKLACYKTISYIPLAQTKRCMGARFAFLRDIVDNIFYRLPDRYITISESQKKLLVAHGVCKNKIQIIHNFRQDYLINRIDKNVARDHLGLEHDKRIIGTIGRINFKQKGQQFFVETIAKYFVNYKNILFVIVGDGPDSNELDQLIAKHNLGNVVKRLPWLHNPEIVYSALDAVVIPSNFEGVPLVMIEAVAYGLPVIATSVDGMQDYLPKKWLFSKGSQNGLKNCIENLLHNDQEHILSALVNEFNYIFDWKRSHNNFTECIMRDSK